MKTTKNNSIKKQPKLKMKLVKGRLGKTIQLNRKVSVDSKTYKDVMLLLHEKKSLTAINKLLGLEMSILRNIRVYAIANGFIEKKLGISLGNVKRGESLRKAKELLTSNNLTTPKEEIQIFSLEKEINQQKDSSIPKRIPKSVEYIRKSVKLTEATESAELAESTESTESVELPEPPKEITIDLSLVTENITKKTIVIDFKGILVQAEVSSVTIKDDIIVVR